MPNIPDIQTLTNANVRQTLGEGGFARSNQFKFLSVMDGDLKDR